MTQHYVAWCIYIYIYIHSGQSHDSALLGVHCDLELELRVAKVVGCQHTQVSLSQYSSCRAEGLWSVLYVAC